MRLESLSQHYTTTLTLALIGALLSIPLQLYFSKHIGRKRTLTILLAVLSSVFLLSTFFPFYEARAVIFPIGICLGVCLTLPNIIPDAILGDIIDYDELRTGTRSKAMLGLSPIPNPNPNPNPNPPRTLTSQGARNEAMYTSVETNIQQGIELILTAAQLCMALTGYTALGGCDCGCGVSCKVLGYTYYCSTYYGYTHWRDLLLYLLWLYSLA